MTGLVRTPDGGYYRPGPERCRLGHPLKYPNVTVGWTGTGPYWYCLHPGHPDRETRWRYPDWANQDPSRSEGTTAPDQSTSAHRTAT